MIKEEIIKRAKELYGDIYDYSLVNDAKSMDNIDILCKKHGIFHKRLSRFLNGSGCPTCSGKIRKTTEQFIEEAKKIHGNKYDYSKTEYNNSHTKVCIICPKHGEFWQSPTNHLNGNGCPKCKGEILSKLFSSNIANFSEKSNLIHNGKYTYDKSEYKNNSTPLLITCPIHGN